MGKDPRLVSNKIHGLQLIKLDLRPDDRGWFKESWQKEKMEAAGLSAFMPIQQNTSFNEFKGTLRGLHAEPWDKLITVAAGTVFCVWVDLRNGKDEPVIETAILGPGESVFVPSGVANGYQTLEDKTSYTYLVNGHWRSDSKYTLINPFDKQLNIAWPIPHEHAIVSERDKSHPSLAEVELENALAGYIIGADGQLGKQLSIELPNFKSFTKGELELGKPEALDLLKLSSSDIVINAAAYTNVDEAETPEGITKAFRSNVLGVKQLAEACLRAGATLVHYSTDYVFDGTKADPYEIDDEVCPINVYGLSKAAGEQLASFNPKTYVIRTSWVFGDGDNFVNKMLVKALANENVSVVNDQHGRPTSTRTLASFTRQLLLDRKPFGTYHLTNSGPSTTWFGFAKSLYEIAGASKELVSPKSSQRVATDGIVAARPKSSVLQIPNHEFDISLWEVEVLDHFAASFKQSEGSEDTNDAPEDRRTKEGA